MPASTPIVVLRLDEQRYGLELRHVERVLPVLAFTPLPSAPAIVLGVVDVAGAVVPVIDLRRRFRLPERELELADCLVLATTSRRRLALVVDGVEGVELSDRSLWLDPALVLPNAAHVAGILRTVDGLTLIHDLDTFLELEEERALDAALSREERAS